MIAILRLMIVLASSAFVLSRPPPFAPVPPAREEVAIRAANDREAFALELLSRLGNDRPTAAIVAMVVEWTLAEDSGDGAFHRNNPLNTTQTGFSETVTINGDGVKGYATRAAGMDATIQTLSYAYYVDVVTALRANDPEGAKRALWASPWAGSHYGYGSAWPTYTRPIGGA